MQVNQTQKLNYTLTQLIPSNVTVTLNVTQPDGTTVSNIAGSSSTNTVQSTQSLSALFTPTMGGRYSLLWTVVDASNNTYTFPSYIWAVWTDVYDAVRAMLGSGVAGIADPILDREFRNIDTELRDYTGQSLPQYWQFTSAYQNGYDQGMAKLLAARVRPYIGGKRPTGEVSLFKKGTTTVQYTSGSPQSLKTLEQQWIEQGMAILEANIPEIYGAAVCDRYGDEVMSRGKVAIGNRHPCAPWNTDLDYSYSIDGDVNQFNVFQGDEM